jgi:hypothetical protein
MDTDTRDELVTHIELTAGRTMLTLKSVDGTAYPTVDDARLYIPGCADPSPLFEVCDWFTCGAHPKPATITTDRRRYGAATVVRFSEGV